MQSHIYSYIVENEIGMQIKYLPPPPYLVSALTSRDKQGSNPDSPSVDIQAILRSDNARMSLQHSSLITFGF